MAPENSFCRSKGIATEQRSEKPQELKTDMRAGPCEGRATPDAAQRRSHRSGNHRETRLGNRAPAERLQKRNVARVTERRRCQNKPPSEFDTVQAPTTEQECGETSWIQKG